MINSKIVKRIRRKKSIRKDLSGTASRPRLSVFRSNVHIYAQLIDDDSRKTIASASDISAKSGTKQERAQKVGTDIAKAAIAGKITSVVFDRNGYKYHGRIKTLADAAREAGLKF